MPTRIVDPLIEPGPGSSAALQRLERLRGYLQHDPGNLALLADVSDLQLHEGQWDAAKGTLLQIMEAEPDNALARYRLAVAERALGNVQQALHQLQILMQTGFNAPVVRLEAASAHAQAGDWATAAKQLEDLNAEALPNTLGDSVWLLRLRAYHHQGDLEAALKEAESWQRARPVNSMPVTGLAAMATLNLDAGRLDALAQVLGHCKESQRDGNAELLAAEGFLALSEGETALAAEHFARSSKLQPNGGRSSLGSGLALAMQGNHQQAIAALHEATRVAPTHLGSWHALAWIQLLNNDIAGAAASFAGALEQDRNFGDTHGGLALIAALRGQKSAAAEHLAIARRLDRRSMNAVLAQLLLEQGGSSFSDPSFLQDGLKKFLDQSGEDAVGILAKVLGSMAKRDLH